MAKAPIVKLLDDHLTRRRGSGEPWADVAESLGLTVDDVRRRVDAYRREARAKAKRRAARAAQVQPETTTINCLKCRQPFGSLNRKTNRICAPCTAENGQQGLDIDFSLDGHAACGGGHWVQPRRPRS